MKNKIFAGLLALSAGFSGATIASADPLKSLESACRTGVYSACSQYNAAIIARSKTQNPALVFGFDPFAIVPATHSERTPKAPAPAPRAGKAGVTATVSKIPQ
jgi:hypothetical protein